MLCYPFNTKKLTKNYIYEKNHVKFPINIIKENINLIVHPFTCSQLHFQFIDFFNLINKKYFLHFSIVSFN
jgi:hypothetical protein